MKIVNTSVRLKQIMNEQNLKQVDILDRCKPYCEKFDTKLNKNDLSQYVSGKVEPGQKKLTILSMALNVNEAWLMGYDVPMNKTFITNVAENSTKYKTNPKTDDNNVFPFHTDAFTKINIYGKVPAGVPLEAMEDIIGEEDIPRAWTASGQEYIALRVTGDSMFPKYIDSDIIIIRLQPDCESGQDAVVYVNGYDATLKTIIKQDDGMIRLQPSNPEFQPKVFYPNNIKILGVVKRLRRDFD